MDSATWKVIVRSRKCSISTWSTQEQQAITTSHSLTILSKFDHLDSQELFIQYIQWFENYMKMKNAFINEICKNVSKYHQD